MPRGNPHNDPGRCPVWEHRIIPDHADSNGRDRSGERTLDVRCSKRKNHKDVHAWKGVPFGEYDTPRPRPRAQFYCSGMTSARRLCNRKVWSEGELCVHHR